MPQVEHTFRQPGPTGPNQGPAGLPSARQVATILALKDFDDFTVQLEDLHNQVHVWVGGTMSEIPLAAFTGFSVHHTMIDRLWACGSWPSPGAGGRWVPLEPSARSLSRR